MFAWIPSENVADELPAPPEDLLTDGGGVSPVSNLLDLHNPSQNFMPKHVQLVASRLFIRQVSHPGLKDLQLSFQFQLVALPYVSKLAECCLGFSK